MVYAFIIISSNEVTIFKIHYKSLELKNTL